MAATKVEPVDHHFNHLSTFMNLGCLRCIIVYQVANPKIRNDERLTMLDCLLIELGENKFKIMKPCLHKVFLKSGNSRRTPISAELKRS